MLKLVIRGAGCLALWLVLAAGWSQSPAKIEPPVQLLSVQSAKILYDVGEAVTGHVVVKNVSPAPRTVTVRAWLEWQLDTTTKPQVSTHTVEAGKTATADFTWKKLPEQFGYALKAEVLLDNNVVAAGEDFFQISDNYWKVSLIAAMGIVMPYEGYKPEWIATKYADWRKDYYNGYEKFFWAPDDVLAMTTAPDAKWYSSVGHYPEQTAGLKTFIDAGHRLGIKAITYERFSGGGSAGMEMARRHPEWMQHIDGELGIDRQVRQLEEWDQPEPTGSRGWVEIRWNMSESAVMDAAAKELLNSTLQYSWDGARWDGTYREPLEWYRTDGTLGAKLTVEQAEAKNARNFRRYKEFVNVRFPHFVYGVNSGGLDGLMAFAPRETMEWCRSGGLIMNEFIRNAATPQDPLHHWADYAPYLVQEVERTKRLGGYYGPILDSDDRPTPDNMYKCIFANAAGAHPYYHHLWGGFMTRYSSYCWDPALTRIANPETLLLAPDTVWWRQWVFERATGKGTRQMIVHLINPPVHAGVGESSKPTDFPPPVKDVAVRIFPSQPGGLLSVRVTRLSPEPLLKESLPIAVRDGVATVTVPEVKLWSILVIDLAPAKGGR